MLRINRKKQNPRRIWITLPWPLLALLLCGIADRLVLALLVLDHHAVHHVVLHLQQHKWTWRQRTGKQASTTVTVTGSHSMRRFRLFLSQWASGHDYWGFEPPWESIMIYMMWWWRCGGLVRRCGGLVKEVRWSSSGQYPCLLDHLSQVRTSARGVSPQCGGRSHGYALQIM